MSLHRRTHRMPWRGSRSSAASYWARLGAGRAARDSSSRLPEDHAERSCRRHSERRERRWAPQLRPCAVERPLPALRSDLSRFAFRPKPCETQRGRRPHLTTCTVALCARSFVKIDAFIRRPTPGTWTQTEAGARSSPSTRGKPTTPSLPIVPTSAA